MNSCYYEHKRIDVNKKPAVWRVFCRCTVKHKTLEVLSVGIIQFAPGDVKGFCGECFFQIVQPFAVFFAGPAQNNPGRGDWRGG